MQGARFSSNETCLRTSKQREKVQQRSSWWVFATPSILTETENPMFREEKEILDEMQSKLDELRGYL